MVWLVSVDNDRWRQVASLIRKPFDHKCCFPSCHLHHLHIIFSSSSSSSSYYHHPHHHQYGSSSVVSKLGPGHLLTTIVVQFNTDPGHLLPSGTWFDLPLDVFALSEIWFMKEEELQVWMMWDLSAVGEEWAEAPEWLPHFVTDHTDRLLLTSAAALLLVYRQTQTSIGQTDHTDRLLLLLVVYRQHRPHRQAALLLLVVYRQHRQQLTTQTQPLLPLLGFEYLPSVCI